jgi:hypothetical protein
MLLVTLKSSSDEDTDDYQEEVINYLHALCIYPAMR